MTKRRTPPGPHNVTEPLDVTFGAFCLSDRFRVPYMTSLLRFQQVAEYLDLVTDDPKYAKQDWTIEELFQREVSQRRVIDLVDHYLKTESRPQFFNSLTVVLKAHDLLPTDFQPPTPNAEYPKSIRIGPITISYDDIDPVFHCPQPLTYGQLAWNRDQVYAVAIDGQHRLAAIKELSREFTRRSSVSVLFLVLAPELGFQAPEGWPETRAMRSVFVDLNKRAERVSRARNLLLDDIDPQAQFVRRLFGPSLSFTPTDEPSPLGFPAGTMGEFDTKIPLVLVDWHGETKSKIEQGPYLSSILAMDWIVTKTLRARHPKRPAIPDLLSMSIDDDGYYKSIERSLKRWTASWEVGGIAEHWQECKEKELPFFLERRELTALADEYESIWGRPITRLLTTVGPYARLVQQRTTANTLTPQFSQWYQARADYESHVNASPKVRKFYEDRLSGVEAELKSDVNIPDYKKLITEIDATKKDSLFFYLVGQRALVLSLISLVESKAAVTLAQQCGIDIQDYATNLQDFYAVYLANAVNAIWDAEPDIFDKGYRIQRDENGFTENLPDAFWAATLVRREQVDSIDFSAKAAMRGSAWFVLMAHLYWFLRVNHIQTRDDASIVLEAALGDDTALDGLALGPQLLESIGRLVSDDYYDAPMTFLAGMIEEPDFLVPYTAAKERVGALVYSLVQE